MIELNLYVVSLVIEEKTKQMTKTIAKQFPVDTFIRRDLSERKLQAPKPICKINAKTIDKDSWNEWLYLVETENGLAWQAPHCPDKDSGYFATMKQRGHWIDEPEKVQTVIL
jgi:hypothetical protein